MTATIVREVMTPNPIFMSAHDTVADAARAMRERQVGDVLVSQDDRLLGILTDRDIVIRCIAEGLDPNTVTLAQVCSPEPVSVHGDQPIEAAIDHMRDRAVRRMPVLEDDMVVGILSIGDLALDRDPNSALADISGAPPTR